MRLWNLHQRGRSKPSRLACVCAAVELEIDFPAFLAGIITQQRRVFFALLLVEQG